MIDINELENKVINNKILISNEKTNIEYKPIVFLLDNDKIVHIGKTDKKVLEYVSDKSTKINCTHYFIELVNIDEIDNILADLVLEIHPIYRDSIPRNTKYISHHKAKSDYHISKTEFKKEWEKYGKKKFRKTLFLEKKVFDDIFSIPLPYSKRMPKIDTLINSEEDIRNTPIDLNSLIQEASREIMEDGTMIEKYVTKRRKLPIVENYKNYKLRKKHTYIVTKIINENLFEAYSEYKNETKQFEAESNAWDEFLGYYSERIIEDYLEYIDSCK